MHFRIENCIVYNSRGSPYFDAGIRLDYVSNGNLIDNTVSDNYYGIRLEESDNNIVSGNTANNSFHYGIYLDYCDNNIVSENHFTNGGSTGIVLNNGEYNTISRNTVNYNSYAGIRLWGWNNDVLENTVNYNEDIGIQLSSQSDDNNIYLNCLNNTLNAVDAAYGLDNHWDVGSKGNFWADYTGLDEDGNGIGDVPYNISGIAGNQDNFPLMTCPSPQQEAEGTIPGYNIFFLFAILPILVIFLSAKLKKQK